jgi:uncharacterized protein YecE (DUF72 family)
MQFVVGTSAYSVPEWKGSFYPDKLSAKKMLPFYAEHFSTVEVNYTFRRTLTANVIDSWAAQVPATFQFSLKAPQGITHFKRLIGTEEAVKAFCKTATSLKQHLGPILFQLPPNFKVDLPRLKTFLKSVPKKAMIAFEFRHESWFIDDVYDLLRGRSCALCLADTDEVPCKKITSTAKWGYIRLRREDYTDAQLRKWVKQLRAQPWDKAYVYFKHEDTGTGPKFAKRFMELASK